LLLGIAALGSPAQAEDFRLPGDECANCPPPRKYDSEQVVKTSRDIDRSRVINTTTVVPVRRSVKETNRLVVHQNTIRNVGVIRHNHTIIEKEVRYVHRVPIDTVVEVITQKYRVVEKPANYIAVPAGRRPVRDCARSRRYDRGSSCGPTLRVRG
jgi:hypothetical protein